MQKTNTSLSIDFGACAEAKLNSQHTILKPRYLMLLRECSTLLYKLVATLVFMRMLHEGNMARYVLSSKVVSNQ